MILANVEIHRAIDDGDIIIRPEPANDSQYQGQRTPAGTLK